MNLTVPLSSVSLATSELLAKIMLILVALFLVTAVSAVYYYWRKMKRTQAAEPSVTATQRA